VKLRLDSLLVRKGLADDLKHAKAIVMAGQVSSDGRRLDKPGLMLDPATTLEVRLGRPYVSRAGEKLASVAEELGIDFKGKIVLDVGSSTGGFTDFALGHGAVHSYCVDVGTGQLDWRLRQDARVTVMEQTDIREAQLPEKADMAVVDVSFVSLKRVLPVTAAWLRPGGLIVALVKPQFEATKSVANRFKGVIKDEAVRQEIIADVRSWVIGEFEVLAEADSKVAGVEGNRECFFLLRAKRAI
jgi:23S rRNA (cytidine1920-2'-O)/16S rRNA (cytidine1409-2'-O)-methyltransferase